MKGDQLEVSLLRAEGHADNDFLKNVEPVVILKYACTQHRVSCVSYAPTVSGTYPWWNQFFYFDVITPHIAELTMKLYDN
ncbi:C2 domain protein [Medicago truncatula]|uniref:C2 domain protein n=1 Tax=Medicago truncatula TaxID=3880 RepID=G7LCQ2_MEDTR|nr:C2 domain protein [Medicago truncatula]